MWRTFLLIGFAACSSGHGGGEPNRPHGGSATPRSGDAGVAVAGGPSEKECEALFAHVSELASREVKSDPPPTADEQKLVTDELTKFAPACSASSRAGYQCAIAAKSLADVKACRAK